MLFTQSNTTDEIFDAIIREADKVAAGRRHDADRPSGDSCRVKDAIVQIADAEEAAAKETDPEKAEYLLVEAASKYMGALPTDAMDYLEVCPLLVRIDQEEDLPGWPCEWSKEVTGYVEAQGNTYYRLTPLGRWFLKPESMLGDCVAISYQVLEGTFEPKACRASAARFFLGEAKRKARSAELVLEMRQRRVDAENAERFSATFPSEIND